MKYTLRNGILIFLALILIFIAILSYDTYTKYKHLIDVKSDLEGIARNTEDQQNSIKQDSDRIQQFPEICEIENLGDANLCLNSFLLELDKLNEHLSNLKSSLSQLQQKIMEEEPEFQKDLQRLSLIAKLIKKEAEIEKIQQIIALEKQELSEQERIIDEKRDEIKNARAIIQERIRNYDPSKSSFDEEMKEIQEIINSLK